MPVIAAKQAIGARLLNCPTTPEGAVGKDALFAALESEGHIRTDLEAALFEMRDELVQLDERVEWSQPDLSSPYWQMPEDVRGVPKPQPEKLSFQVVWPLPALRDWYKQHGLTPKSLDADVQAILDRARQKQNLSFEAQRTFEANQQRLGRAWHAWSRVRSFRGDAIPDRLTGLPLWRRYSELIVELGKVLKTDGWQSAVDAVSPGEDAKTYAIALLRKAMEGDFDAVYGMVHQSVDTALHFSLEADSWLREGLMYEVLGVQRPPEPPLGWEGPYHDAVESVRDIMLWIDREIIGAEMFNRNRGNDTSSGEMVRNAFRLVDKLEIPNLPLEPGGTFTLNKEVRVLRNLRRLLSSAAGEADSESPPMKEAQTRKTTDEIAQKAEGKHVDPAELAEAIRRLIDLIKSPQTATHKEMPTLPFSEVAPLWSEVEECLRWTTLHPRTGWDGGQYGPGRKKGQCEMPIWKATPLTGPVIEWVIVDPHWLAEMEALIQAANRSPRLAGMSTKTPTPSEPPPTDATATPPAVSKIGKLILAALLKHYPTLQTIEEICDEVKGDSSERTIGPELKTLIIKDGLAERPRGPRKGAWLTPAGKALAEKLSPP
jgi:hypothetical protein